MKLTHHFLLSMPQMQDSNFSQSLIYILEHSDEGSWGLIINQPMGMALGDVFDQLDMTSSSQAIQNEPVLNGGPVQQDQGQVLHLPGPTFESTREFTDGVSLSSSRDVLESMAAGEEPHERLMLLGHAGWAPGQLEAEISDNAWLSCAANLDVIFTTPIPDKRQAVSGLMGFDLNSVVGHAGHA